MAPKKKKAEPPKRAANIAAEIENAGVVIEQPLRKRWRPTLCLMP